MVALGVGELGSWSNLSSVVQSGGLAHCTGEGGPCPRPPISVLRYGPPQHCFSHLPTSGGPAPLPWPLANPAQNGICPWGGSYPCLQDLVLIVKSNCSTIFPKEVGSPGAVLDSGKGRNMEEPSERYLLSSRPSADGCTCLHFLEEETKAQ